MASPGVRWTAIVLTTANKDWTYAFQKELELRQAKGYIGKDVIVLTVEDPKSYVGSGGATINALVTITEYISAQQGHSVISAEVLEQSKILILHSGRQYPYDQCGRAFVTLPAEYVTPEYDGLICNIDILIKNITEKLAVKSGPGLWVSSTDMILSFPKACDIPWKNCDACAITVPATPQYCKHHGVYKIDKEGYVENILYQKDVGSLECCEIKDGKVPVVCSVVFFNYLIAQKLLAFHVKPPLDACTYMGLDSGEPPIQLSLFFDVMLPMATGVTETDFVNGKWSRNATPNDPESQRRMKKARSLLWKELGGYKMWACLVESGQFHYLSGEAQDHKRLIQNCPYQTNFSETAFTWSNRTHSYIESSCKVDENSTIVNSALYGNVTVGGKTVVSCCKIRGNVTLGKDCYVAGLKVETVKKTITIDDSMVVQSFNVHLRTLGITREILTIHGRYDKIQVPYWKSSSTFCNMPMVVWMTKTGIVKEDLWGTDVENEDQSMFQAKLFPILHATDSIGLEDLLWIQGAVPDEDRTRFKRWQSSWRLSMKEILSFVNAEQELQCRREMFYEVKKEEISDALIQKLHKGFHPIYNSAGIDGFSISILEKLDSVAKTSQNDPGVAARTLANIADVLGSKAGLKGGLRSGPAANKAWAKAFNLLENKELERGVTALAKERSKWLDRPDLLVRAARHYEGAAQILIRQAVMTAKEYFKPESCSMPFMNKWVTALCPARIDVSGGWSDTPPITYEHGGAVTMVALQVKGKHPVGAKAKRIDEPKLVFVIYGNDGDNTEVICREISDLEDYYQPYSPGALLKASFICADIVSLSSPKSLRDQLMEGYAGGFEVHSWSVLPQGSGMGTSSILAGAVMAAVLRASGKSCDKKGLIHAVLYLEQLLTTGGGWQDQVGGLMGGIKIGLSEAKLPIAVEAVDLKVSDEVIQMVNERLLLIYTGKTRLARNLLQEVVRNWYARNPNIVETENALVVLAQECAHGFIDGDLRKVGSCLDNYWSMKKILAPGCETPIIAKLMAAARPFAYGMCMAGAGGGGFLYVLTKDKNQKHLLLDILGTVEGTEGKEVYECSVDREGLVLTVED
ncbi:L-fucose kinase-like isoform X1 [Ostrea edulis]|uniref:L-fucose kinase-like isoform X1 n=1 Tax=Ostrea edulis TaxID=37623 RepID=UPI0024AE9B1C|nr:L-fucose kinase-like isoform X1 [Ostrea edulis]